MRPSGLLVVGDAVGEAAVEDADEAVREGAQGLVVRGPAGSMSVVVGAGSWRGDEGSESLLESASARRRLRAYLAKTTRLVPDARVIGDMPE